MITAHDYITSKYAEAANVDITLIGDSLAMTSLGYDTPNEIPFEEMLYHIKAVSRGNKKSLLVADLPFGSFEQSEAHAIESAIRIIKEGKVHAVKLEYNTNLAPTVNRLGSMGIPVMGHVGLTPQQHNTLGGFRLQGSNAKRALQIYKQCLEMQDNGAFAIVLECVPNKVAELITENLRIPTIGIGAGPYCAGQVLVAADVLGMNNPDVHRAKFVKQYANQYEESVGAFRQYINEVETKQYPLPEHHGYLIKKDELNEFKAKFEEYNSRNYNKISERDEEF